MLFKGTAELKAGEFSRRVAALGGRENAFTSKDYTGYYQQIPSARLEDVMRLEADRFANNQWADGEFAKEIEVVKEERRLRTEDNPRAMMSEALTAAVFVASPYRRPVVGWMSDLDAMTAADVREFYRRWYVPANAAVVVAGDVDVDQVRRLAEKYYGPILARPVPSRKPRIEPMQAGQRRLEFKAPAEQAQVTLAFKVPGLDEPASAVAPGASPEDALALTVLAAVLDGYSGARLDRTLSQGAGRLADNVWAYNGLWGRGPQLFVLGGIPAPGKTTAELEAALRGQVLLLAIATHLAAHVFHATAARIQIPLQRGIGADRRIHRRDQRLPARPAGAVLGRDSVRLRGLRHRDRHPAFSGRGAGAGQAPAAATGGGCRVARAAPPRAAPGR
jgi:zinc protease